MCCTFSEFFKQCSHEVNLSVMGRPRFLGEHLTLLPESLITEIVITMIVAARVLTKYHLDSV